MLNVDALKKAVLGEYAAIRRITRLEPQGDKIFPPTYEGGEYADEPRQVQVEEILRTSEGERKIASIRTVETVLLDSVQSQANRMELVLLRAYDAGRIRLPMLQVDFAGDGSDPILTEIRRITALEAPHRMCDAIFRDAVWQDGKPFRDAGAGARLNTAKSANATAVFELCPTALLFGFWDSTGPRGGLGAKVQRAIVSEIVGFEIAEGKRTASRIDPLQIENNVEVYKKKGGGWTFDPALAETKNGEPVRTKPSEINHGNIVPSFRHKDDATGKVVLNHGGVTLAYAIQHTVLSLAALRRLRFPVHGKNTADVDNAARVVLATVGLAAICLLDEDGYDLRSRCLLDGKPGTFEFVGRGETKPFELDATIALELVAQAVTEAKKAGLPWPEKPVTLKPSPDLSRLVVESRKRSMSATAGD